jgi:hypothetical protein
VRVWDAETEECLEVIEGARYSEAIAADPNHFPWRAVGRRAETVIEPSIGNEAVAWFPINLNHISTHPSGRVWAGSEGNDLYIIKLEGGPDLGPTGEKQA